MPLLSKAINPAEQFTAISRIVKSVLCLTSNVIAVAKLPVRISARLRFSTRFFYFSYFEFFTFLAENASALTFSLGQRLFHFIFFASFAHKLKFIFCVTWISSDTLIAANKCFLYLFYYNGGIYDLPYSFLIYVLSY